MITSLPAGDVDTPCTLGERFPIRAASVNPPYETRGPTRVQRAAVRLKQCLPVGTILTAVAGVRALCLDDPEIDSGFPGSVHTQRHHLRHTIEHHEGDGERQAEGEN